MFYLVFKAEYILSLVWQNLTLEPEICCPLLLNSTGEPSHIIDILFSSIILNLMQI